MSYIYVFPCVFTLTFALLLDYTHCLNNKFLNIFGDYRRVNSYWLPASATWYGSPNGAGNDGGACGYLDSVESPPFSGMTSSCGSSIFESGDGCGVCYQVKCTEHRACSGEGVTVTIIDHCPGCRPSDMAHFDLSGKAFGAMAKYCLADQLRNAGNLYIQYQRVKCNYPGVPVAIRVDQGSNPRYFAFIMEYEDGEGIESIKLKHQYGGWIDVQQSWGATWVLNLKLNLKLNLERPFLCPMLSLGAGIPAKYTDPMLILGLNTRVGFYETLLQIPNRVYMSLSMVGSMMMVFNVLQCFLFLYKLVCVARAISWIATLNILSFIFK